MKLLIVRKRRALAHYDVMRWDDGTALALNRSNSKRRFRMLVFNVRLHRIVNWPYMADAIALSTLMVQQSLRPFIR